MAVVFGGRDRSQRLIELKFAVADLMQLQTFRQGLKEEDELKGLGESTGIDDGTMLRRLYDAGFRARNIHTIHWLPISMVAWASEGVTDEEVRAAELVSLHSLFNCDEESTQLFRQWLSERPTEKMIKLWEDFVAHLLTRQETKLSIGGAVLYVAKKVAEASGGILGFGQISPAEQKILDRIRVVYNLQDAM